MKRKPSLIFALALASTLFLFGGGHAAKISPESSTGVYPPATDFWVDINIADVSSLFGTSFRLSFDQTAYIDLVSPDSVVADSFLGVDLVFYSNVDSNSVAVAVSKKSGDVGVDGSGTVVRMKFSASALTPLGTAVNFTISEVVATDSSGNDITLADSTLTITIEGLLVWPGDANDNGYVDQADILPIGLYWQQSGPARTNGNRSWVGQPTLLWSPQNATYADCDGNGLVDQADILAIGLNWHKSSGLLLASASGQRFEESSTVLDASIFYYDVREIDLEKHLYSFDIFVTPEYSELFQGISFSAAGIKGAKIVNVEKGESWSVESLIFARETDEKWGVGITEVGNGSPDHPTNMLARVVFTAPGNGLDFQQMIDLKDLNISLVSGEIVELGDALNNGSPAAAGSSLPRAFELAQNYPNPFNPSTTISYSVPEGSPRNVSLSIFDIRGRLVKRLVNRPQAPGSYDVFWDGTDTANRKVSSGIYFYRMMAGEYTRTRKMVMLK